MVTKLDILRREIALGLEAAAAGRFSTKTVSDIAEEVLREFSEPQIEASEEPTSIPRRTSP